MGDLLGSPRVAPPRFAFLVPLFAFLVRGLSEWARTLRFLLDSLPSITGAHAVAHLAELGEHIFELKIHRFSFQIPSFYQYCA